MLKYFYVLLLFVILLSCNKNDKNHNYLKTNRGLIYKANYDSTIQKESRNKISIGFGDTPYNLNPFLSNSSSEIFLKLALFSSLFYVDSATLKVEKNLVDNYYHDNSCKNYFFTLKDNLHFNNGQKLESDDVVLSLSLLEKYLKETDIYNNFYMNNQKIVVEKISGTRFSISLENPNSNILYALSRYPILPDDVVSKFLDNTDDFYNYYDFDKIKKINGSGPYMITGIDDRNIELTKNPYYFKKDKSNIKLPYTDNISLKFNKYKNKEIVDFIENKTDVTVLESNNFNNLYNYYYGTNEAKFIDTGMDNQKVLIAYNCYNKNSKIFLKDTFVRKILSGIIHEALLKSNLNDKKSFVRKLQVDKTFQNSGYMYKNSDGNFEYKDKTRIVINLICPEEDELLTSITKIVYNGLKEKGIDVNYELMPYHIFIEKIFYKKDYDIAFINYKFNPGLLSYYKLLKDENYKFSPFIDDNDRSVNYINGIINNAIYAGSLNAQNEQISKLTNYLNNNYQLYPVYERKNYYIIKSNIFNFRINSGIDNQFDLKTIESIIKIEE